MIFCARATRGRGFPSLDARTLGTRQATPPTTWRKGMNGGFGGQPLIGMDQPTMKT
jgi:hypothetical protein